MGKAMKKAMKTTSMKAMRKRRVMKVSIRGQKWQVFKGTKQKSNSGLTKADLTKNKRGKVVSKKKAASGKALFQKHAKKWIMAVEKARKSLNIKGFTPVGGKTAKGQEFLKKARSFYKK